MTNESDIRVGAALQVLQAKIQQLMQELVNAHGEVAVQSTKKQELETKLEELHKRLDNMIGLERVVDEGLMNPMEG